MLDLSPETEALARRKAQEQGLSVDEAVRRALEGRKKRASSPPISMPAPPEVVAQRRAVLERAIATIAALPELDSRSSREIMDDLDPL